MLIGLLVASIVIGGTGLLGSGVLLLGNQDLNTQLQEADSDHEQLLSDYEDLNNTYSDLLGQYDTLLEVHTSLTSDYTTVTNQYNEAMDTLNETIEDCKILNQTYQNLIMEYESLNSTYYILTGEHLDLNWTYYELTDQHEQLNQTYYGLVADYELLESQNATMTALYSELLQNQQILQNDYDELLDSYSTLQTDYNTLQNDYNTLQNDYQSLESEYFVLSDDYDTLLQNYQTLSQSYQLLQQSYQTLQQDYNNLWDSYNQLDQDYSQLSADYNSLESEYQTLNSTFYDLQNDYRLLNDSYTTLTTWISQQILPVQYCLFAEAVRRYYEPLYLSGATTKESFMGFAEFARDIVLHDSYQYNAFSDVSNALSDALILGNDTMELCWQIMYNVFYSYSASQRWLPNWGGWGLTGNNLTDIDTVHQWCVDTIAYEYDSDITLLQEPAFGDYIKFPVETAFRTMGDCEDQAILDAAYLESCGFETAIAVFHDPTHPTIGSFYHGTLLVHIEDTDAFFSQYPGAYLWTFGSIDPYYGDFTWCWLDPTWDVPFGSTPGWLQGYLDYGGLTFDIMSIAFCDIGGAVG